jgi:PAT family beta-lactamase induction signal transducer AmpG
MLLPNLLESARGRLAAFFLLYVTEGIPLGFAATAVATQLRRAGVGPAEIGAFVASFYLPWAFKWAFGPFVDVFRSRRLGHRRAWILGTQLGMAASLLGLLAVPLPQGLALFTAILFVHNLIAAAQDVAIDALAVNTLAQSERGLANGLMFAGASVGQALGGAGVLFAMGAIGLQGGIVAVACSILLVTVFVVLPMKEKAAPQQALASAQAAVAQMRGFAKDAFRSFLGARSAFLGVWFALLPMGAMSLSLALQSNLSVELGMDDDAVATLTLAATIVSGASMVLGGWVADRLGLRRTLAVYTVLMSLPVLYLAWVLQSAGYVMPRPPGQPPIPALIWHLWFATMAFNVAMGLMYGTRTAVYMDITNPLVAGTQFTAYMAMMNLAISLAATWQGVAIEALGYPLTLVLDAALGVVSLALLPWMNRVAQGTGLCDQHAASRARAMARVLAVVLLGFAAWWWLRDENSAATGVVNTLFSLAFVASALFLYAATLLQDAPVALTRVWRWLALGLLLLYARHWLDALPSDWQLPVKALLSALPVAAAWALWRAGRRDWPGLVAARQGFSPPDRP